MKLDAEDAINVLDAMGYAYDIIRADAGECPECGHHRDGEITTTTPHDLLTGEESYCCDVSLIDIEWTTPHKESKKGSMTDFIVDKLGYDVM